MHSDPLIGTLGLVVLVLLLGTAAALIARSLRLSPIVGYIALGLLARASGFQSLEARTIEILAELGVVFLLFDIGLHFSITQIKERASDIFAFGPVQILAGTLLMGTLGVIFGGAPLPMFLAAATLSLSSTAVVARIIAERHQQNCPVGLTATAILVFQDVAGILLLIIVSSMGGSQGAGMGILTALGKASLAVVVSLIGGRFIVRPLFALVTKAAYEEVATAAALIIALAGAWATGQVGLSLTLGAFLAGMSLADTPYRVTIHAEVSAFRGLLLGFFFIAVGYGLDIHFLKGAWYWVIVGAALLFSVKTLSNVAASLLFRWSVPGSVQLGLLIAQGSELGLILLTAPPMRALLGDALSSLLVSVTALSLALTPTMARAGRLLAGHMRRRKTARVQQELTPTRLSAPVLIVGMGEVGRNIADALRDFGIAYFAVERDQKRLQAAIADGYEVEYGDTTDTRHWEPIELGHRSVSVLTTPDLPYLSGTHTFVMTKYPQLTRLVVAPSEEKARAVRNLGLRVIVDQGHPRGLEASAAVLSLLDRTETEIADWRQRFIASRRQFGGWGTDSPAELASERKELA